MRKLLIALANGKGINITGEKQFRGVFQQQYSEVDNNAEYEVLIANCCNDETVVTQIRDRYGSLSAAGYSVIIGLRDLYPIAQAELGKAEQRMATVLPQGGVPVHVCIAVSEVEAWFIEEITHFERLDVGLTPAAILAATGYDIQSRKAENLEHPADTLNNAYQVAGMAWRKTDRQVTRLVDVLDYAFLHSDSRGHSASLNGFLAHVDNFLS